jgi:hypothetical protein
MGEALILDNVMLNLTQTFSGEKSIKDDIYDDREAFSDFSY